jgi:hypothetical protein
MRSFRLAWPDAFYLVAALLLLRPLAGLLNSIAEKIALNQSGRRRVEAT